MSIANVEINVHVSTTDLKTCIPDMGFFSLQNEYIRVPAPCSQSNLRPFKENNQMWQTKHIIGESMKKITFENGKTI